MNKLNIILEMCVVLTISLPQISSRKYDVNAEAIRLYGEDLNAVLRRFRRTPEYMMLLQERYEQILELFHEVMNSALDFVTENRLKKRLADVCNFQELFETSPIVRYYKSFNARRDGEQSQEKETSTTLSPIELLDKYKPFLSLLSTKERNKIKVIAFESAGEVIHLGIRGMGPLDPRSTRQPFGDDQGKYKVTTERDHRHVISTQGLYEMPGDMTSKNPGAIDSPVENTLRAIKGSNSKIF